VTALRIARAAGLSTVQDGGRRGYLRHGIPPGGALVPELLARANAAAHNTPCQAAVETFGSVTVVARGQLQLGSDDGSEVELRDGESWTLTCDGARLRYLAVRGGVDVPVVLGARGTLLVASLGGMDGRALRAGDELRVGTIGPNDGPLPPALDLTVPIHVIPGPDQDLLPDEALEQLLSGAFGIDPRSDRVGVRLMGPLLPRPGGDTGASRPMVRGAIQVPPDGQPIVLGPDHPVTGGYPVIATVATEDLGRLGALPVGSPLRLVMRP